MIPNALRVYRINAGQVLPDRLSVENPQHLTGTIRKWVECLPGQIGQSRSAIEAALLPVGEIKNDRWDKRRHSALTKIFLDRQKWDTKKSHFDSRQFVEAVNARLLIPVQSSEDVWRLDRETLNAAAVQVGFESFADLLDAKSGNEGRYNLAAPVTTEPENLLAEYDLLQLRAALFNCSSAVVEASEDLNAMVRIARLSGFSFEVAETSKGYTFVLKSTDHFLGAFAFGRGLSKFANSLVRLRGWTMTAQFQDHVFAGEVRVSAESGYSSAKGPPPQFASKVEERFWTTWHRSPRLGWTLHREPRLLVNGEHVYCPDFEARKEGNCVLIEIVGKNDPRYAIPKVASLEKFDLSGAILLVKRDIADLFSRLPATIITHSNQPNVEKVIDALELLHPGSVAHRE